MAGAHTKDLRRVREGDLVTATRALFDGRGVQDAPIEEIAKAVGIARGLIYRVFSSKEELFVLTVTDYLAELADALEEAVESGADTVEQARSCVEAYARFCARYPAFLDCSLSLMQRPARELNAMVSESVWLRLGQGMARCLEQVSSVLRAGVAAGSFDIEDPDYMANLLWTQTLGAMHLARIRVGVREVAPGIPELFRVDPEQVVQSCVRSALASLGA
jgi:AcrR family transcriptional regulator